jgi:hypothetical protein
VDLVKIPGVADWPTPTNQEVQSFVRFINFHCQFIPKFSHHAHTLFNLTMKDVVRGTPFDLSSSIFLTLFLLLILLFLVHLLVALVVTMTIMVIVT